MFYSICNSSINGKFALFLITVRYIPHTAAPCGIAVQKNRHQLQIQIESLIQFRQLCAMSEIPVQLTADQTGSKIHPVIESARLIDPILRQIIKFVPADQSAGIAIAQMSHALADVPCEITVMAYYGIKLS